MSGLVGTTGGGGGCVSVDVGGGGGVINPVATDTRSKRDTCSLSSSGLFPVLGVW